MPHNREALVVSSSNLQGQLQELTKNLDTKLKFKDKGVGEYSLSLSSLPPSPRSHGQPTLSNQKIATTSTSQYFVPITKFDGQFIKANTIEEEAEDRDILSWLYKDEDESLLHIKLPKKQYGKGYAIMQKMGYEGNGPIGKRREGILEPIQPISIHPNDKTGLGYGKDTKESILQQAQQTHERASISDKHHEDVTLQKPYGSVFQLQDGSDTDSNEYEWDTIYNDEFWRDKQVDTIHKYALVLIQGESLGTQSLELDSRYNNDSTEDDSIFHKIDNRQENTIIDLVYHEDDNHIMTLTTQDLTQPNDPMPLIYP